MKLRAITLRDMRQFTEPVRIDGIGDGLNVLSAPNESGKSTVFDAIRAAFLLPHRSTKIRDLRPAIGGNPEIEIDLEWQGAAYRLHKRWGRGNLAAVWRDGREIARADAAESWIARLTQAAEDGGPTGLLWVRQGLVDLDGGSTTEQRAAQAARRDLMSSVTGEIESLTGGRRMDRALAQATAELEQLETSRGPKAGGPLDLAARAAAELEDRRAALAAQHAAMAHALDRRRSLTRDLEALNDPEEVAAREARLVHAQAALTAGERHAERAERLALETARAVQALEALETRQARWSEADAAHRVSATAAAQAIAAEHEAQAAFDRAKAAQATARTADEAARAALVQAEAGLHAALLAQARQAQARSARAPAPCRSLGPSPAPPCRRSTVGAGCRDDRLA